MRSLVLMGMAVTLSGCAGSLAEQAFSPEKVAQREDETCWSYGFERGSQQYAQCRMQLNQNRTAQNMQSRAMVAQGLDNMSRSMAAPPNNAVNCTTTGPYGYRTTTCN